jgi:hypothetical protein
MAWFKAVQYSILTYCHHIHIRPTLDILEATDTLLSKMTAAPDKYTHGWPLLRGHGWQLKVGSWTGWEEKNTSSQERKVYIAGGGTVHECARSTHSLGEATLLYSVQASSICHGSHKTLQFKDRAPRWPN